MCIKVERKFKSCSSLSRHTYREVVMCQPAQNTGVWCDPIWVGTGVAVTSTSIVCPTCNRVKYEGLSGGCSSTMGSGSAEPSGGSSGGRQPTPLDLDSKGTQIIELGSAVWPENPIRTGRSEVYIWGTEHAVKFCMGPSFALHEYTMSRAARNSAVHTVAMFMIHGKPLGIVMERGKPVNPETCELSLKQIAFEMVRAVQELHSVGIIHGDIKLSNFLVCRDGRVRLCDFETSEYECDCVSHSELSIPWSRPSVVRNPDKPRVKADDLYSLGLAIWELYTGKVPFKPPGSEGWKSLDISEAAEEAILAGEQVDLNDILDLEVRSVAASLVSEEV